METSFELEIPGRSTPEVPEKRCYTVEDLQNILMCGKKAVYELLKRNVFRSFIVGGKYIISKSSFDEWLDGDSQTEKSQKVMDF